MTSPVCPAEIPFDALVEYWLGESDAAAADAIDEHLLGCDVCGARLDDMIALAGGVRGALAAGLVGTFVSAAFVRRIGERGQRVREYRVPRNGSVDCGVAPDDDWVVTRYQVPLTGVTRVDVVSRSSLAAHEVRRADVPFDAAGGEVLFVPSLAQLRRLPASRLEVRLLAVDAAGEHPLGHYTLNHSPWPPGGRP